MNRQPIRRLLYARDGSTSYALVIDDPTAAGGGCYRLASDRRVRYCYCGNRLPWNETTCRSCKADESWGQVATVIEAANGGKL